MKRELKKPKKKRELGRSDVVAGPQFPMRDRRRRREADRLRRELQAEAGRIDETLKGTDQ